MLAGAVVVSSLAVDPPRGSATWHELVATVKLAAPIAIAQFGFVALTLVDTAIVGKTSTTALAGASIGRSLMFAFSSFGMGISSAIEPLASQAIAAHEPDRAWSSLLRTLVVNVWIFPAIVVLTFCTTALLPWFGVDAPTLVEVRRFLVGQIPGMLLFPAFVAAKAFAQAHGRTIPAMVASVVANGINWIACTLLVRSYGTLGAGLAASLAAFVLFAGTMGPAWRLRATGPTQPPTYRRIIGLGVPMGLQLLAEIGVFSVVSFLAARFGTTSVAAHQIALGLASFSFMGALGVSGATAVRVGRAIGHGVSPRRAGLVGIAIGGGVMLASIVIFTMAPAWLVTLFTADAEVIRLGVPLVMLAAFFQFFDGMQAVAGGALRGAGDVRFAFLANLFCHWCIGLPISLWLGFVCGWQTRGFWVGLSAGLIAVALALTWRFFVVSGRVIQRV